MNLAKKNQEVEMEEEDRESDYYRTGIILKKIFPRNPFPQSE
jgi:hypothetical protein